MERQEIFRPNCCVGEEPLIIDVSWPGIRQVTILKLQLAK